MIVVHDINKKQGKKFWSHLDVFSLCYVLLKKVAPIAPRAPRAPISREYVRINRGSPRSQLKKNEKKRMPNKNFAQHDYGYFMGPKSVGRSLSVGYMGY